MVRNVTAGRRCVGIRVKSGQIASLKRWSWRSPATSSVATISIGPSVRPKTFSTRNGSGGDVVEVRMRHDDRAHLRLLLERERLRERAPVEGDRPVEKEGRLSVPGRGAAVRSEDTNAHVGILGRRRPVQGDRGHPFPDRPESEGRGAEVEGRLPAAERLLHVRRAGEVDVPGEPEEVDREPRAVGGATVDEPTPLGEREVLVLEIRRRRCRRRNGPARRRTSGRSRSRGRR